MFVNMEEVLVYFGQVRDVPSYYAVKISGVLKGELRSYSNSLEGLLDYVKKFSRKIQLYPYSENAEIPVVPLPEEMFAHIAFDLSIIQTL